LDRAVRAIGADKHIAGRDADVGEESNNPAVRANLVTLEGLTEVHDVLQPVQQVSAEGFPVGGVPLFGCVVACRVHDLVVDDQECLQLIVRKPKPPPGFPLVARSPAMPGQADKRAVTAHLPD
jgi:hypothetical protein